MLILWSAETFKNFNEKNLSFNYNELNQIEDQILIDGYIRLFPIL